MKDQGPGNHDGYTRIEDQELAEIGRIVESWVGGLPFEAVYELVKRFHFHLALKLFIDDKEGFEELKSVYGGKGETEGRPHIHVTKLLLTLMDNLDDNLCQISVLGH